MNESKKESPIMWEKWRVSGAVANEQTIRDVLTLQEVRPEGVRVNHGNSSGPSSPLTLKTARRLLASIFSLARSGYEDKSSGLHIKTIPPGMKKGEVTVVAQTKCGCKNFPGSSYATVILEGSNKQIHFYDPDKITYGKNYPLATETDGKKALAAIAANRR